MPRLSANAALGLCALLSMFFLSALGSVKAMDVEFEPDVEFIGADAVLIQGNVMLPRPEQQNNSIHQQKFPAIIFINSWGLEEHEYIVQAYKLAQQGYIVLSYSARGWGKSGGTVNVAGPKDMADFSAAIDWLIANTPVDEKRIGSAGISYGAGMALLGGAFDKRIKAVASLSGWGDLADSLYGQETVDLVWGTLLVGVGYLNGRMDPYILEVYQNLLAQRNMEEVLAWTALRSPMHYIDKLNERKLPVYFSNNFRDELFEPNSIIKLFEQLQGPKRLDLNLGNHTTAELGGLVGLQNYVWTNLTAWFDVHLKGKEDTRGVTSSKVSMAVKFESGRDEFENWPHSRSANEIFYLSPKSFFSDGKLSTQPNRKRNADAIYNGILSGASAGVPVLSSILESHINVPVYANVNIGLNPALAVVYESTPFREKKKIRGIPNVSLWLKPSAKNTQVVAYLYDVGSFGNARLITHGPISLRDATPNRTYRLDFELIATSYNVPKGNSIALVLDTQDEQYSPASIAPYRIELAFDRHQQSTLSLPFSR